jgi:hypothetical protein
MIHAFVRLAALALVLASTTACTRSAEEPFGRLSVDEVADKLGNPGVYVYDNNPKERYAAGHVPGATWLDYDQVSASDLPQDKAATLIFYCANEH